MQRKHRLSPATIAVLACAVACALALGACGSGGSASGTATGMEPRDSTEMEQFTEQALQIAVARQVGEASEAEEGEQSAAVADDFAAANKAYREGSYGEATDLYEKVITTYPKHFGANVNLTLSQLQEGKAEEALTQSLVCWYLFSEDADCALNVQVAGTACGFGEDDIDAAINQMDVYRSSDMTASPDGAFTYNSLWNKVELMLYKAANADESERAQVTEEFEGLVGQLYQLSQENPDDADVQALLGYFEAACTQLGLIDGAGEAAA